MKPSKILVFNYSSISLDAKHDIFIVLGYPLNSRDYVSNKLIFKAVLILYNHKKIKLMKYDKVMQTKEIQRLQEINNAKDI